jgi:hypothetical protein
MWRCGLGIDGGVRPPYDAAQTVSFFTLGRSAKPHVTTRATKSSAPPTRAGQNDSLLRAQCSNYFCGACRLCLRLRFCAALAVAPNSGVTFGRACFLHRMEGRCQGTSTCRGGCDCGCRGGSCNGVLVIWVAGIDDVGARCWHHVCRFLRIDRVSPSRWSSQLRRQAVSICRWIPVLALLWAVPQVFAEPASSGGGAFAVSFDPENWRKCPRSGPVRCLLGKVPSNQSWLLLGAQNSATCLVRAKMSFESEWEAGSFALTQIDTKACPSFRFELAVRGVPQRSYQWLKQDTLPTASPQMQRQIERSVRAAVPKIPSSGPEHMLGLTLAKPQIFRFPSMAPNTYIAVFENSNTPGDQVHFLYSPSGVKLVHSAASIVSIFSLGNRHYIHYKFTCRIGCGYVGDLVVQFPENGFRVEMFDAELST